MSKQKEISVRYCSILDVNNPANGVRDRSRSPLRDPRGGARGRERGCRHGAQRGAQRGSRANRRQPCNSDPELQWSRDATQHAPPPDFVEVAPGPARRFVNSEEISAKSYFDLFFTDNVWEIIVRETNKYHDYMVQTEPAKHKMAWTPVTRDEMEAFVGILVLMGIVNSQDSGCIGWKTPSCIRRVLVQLCHVIDFCKFGVTFTLQTILLPLQETLLALTSFTE